MSASFGNRSESSGRATSSVTRPPPVGAPSKGPLCSSPSPTPCRRRRGAVRPSASRVRRGSSGGRRRASRGGRRRRRAATSTTRCPCPTRARPRGGLGDPPRPVRRRDAPLGGGVGGAVVEDDDLVDEAGRHQLRLHFAHDGRDRRVLVPGGEAHRDRVPERGASPRRDRPDHGGSLRERLRIPVRGLLTWSG